MHEMEHIHHKLEETTDHLHKIFFSSRLAEFFKQKHLPELSKREIQKEEVGGIGKIESLILNDLKIIEETDVKEEKLDEQLHQKLQQVISTSIKIVKGEL